MPTEQVKEEKTVDIDTAGPGAEIELPEEKEKLVEQEETNAKTDKNDTKSDDTPQESDKQPDVQDSKPEEKQEEVKEKQETEDKEQETKTEDKKELEEYSEGVKKRIAKLTKKMREAERQKEAAIEYARSVQADSTELQKKVSTLEPNYMKAMEGRVTSGLQAAESKLAAAREAGNIKAEVEAQKLISKLGLEEARVEIMKQKAAADAKKKPVAPRTLDQVIAPTEQSDPKAEEWADRNEWFGKDNAMTYTAFDLHKKLTEKEGFDPQSDEYYAEIDKRMRLDFPHKFSRTDTTVTTRPTQTVASAKRSVNTGRKSVRLTSSQVAIAKKLGVPLEEYAKQLKITKEA